MGKYEHTHAHTHMHTLPISISSWVMVYLVHIACCHDNGFPPAFAIFLPRCLQIMCFIEKTTDRTYLWVEVGVGEFTFTNKQTRSSAVNAADTHTMSELVLSPGVTDGSTHLLPFYWICIILSHGCDVPGTASDSVFSVSPPPDVCQIL